MSSLLQTTVMDYTKPLPCAGPCQNYRASMPGFNQSRYAVGQKRCTKCGLFMIYDGRFCPCCGFRLRIKRRSSKAKRQARAIIN